MNKVLNNEEKKRVLSEATKKKISESMRGKNVGKVRTEQMRKNISSGLKGKPKSEETKKKISIANTGRKLSDEAKEKIKQNKLAWWANYKRENGFIQ